jgi:predicted HicB family RNase H-like nuclease
MMSLDVPKRLFATVPDYVAEALERRAQREGRSVSNLVAFLLEQEVNKAPEEEPPTSDGEEPKQA